MTLRQLEVFLAVAKEKSFSLAAKKLHSSQPTLSEHISELESELGKHLFFRRGRRRVVTVTEAGQAALLEWPGVDLAALRSAA